MPVKLDQGLGVSRKGLGRPKKFAPCELGVRTARTGSSDGANWKSAPGGLFGMSETIMKETRTEADIAPAGASGWRSNPYINRFCY